MSSPVIVRNLVELFAAHGVRIVARALIAALLVRRLGLEDYGAVALALALGTFGGDLGIGATGVREVSRDPTAYKRIAGTVMVMQGSVQLTKVIATLVLLSWFAPSESVASLCRIFAASSLLWIFDLNWLHLARDRANVVRNGVCLAELAWLGGILAFVHEPAHVARTAPIYVASRLLAVIYLLVAAVRREGWPQITSPSVKSLRAVGQALALWASASGVDLRAQVGLFALGHAFGTAAVGAFDIAWKLAFLAMSVGEQAVMSFIPTLMRAKPDGLYGELRRFIRVLAVLVVPAAVLHVALAGWALGALFGVTDETAVLPARLLGIAIIPGILRVATDWGLFAAHARLLARNLSLDAFVLAPLAILAATRGGPAALAATLVGTEMVLLGVSIASHGADLTRGASAVFASYLGALCVAAILGAGISLADGGMIVSAVFGTIAYAVILIRRRDPVVRTIAEAIGPLLGRVGLGGGGARSG